MAQKATYKELRRFTVSKQPVSIFRNKNSNSKKDVARSMRIDFTDIESIPDELLTVKVSQSANPQKAGKVVFRWLNLSYGEGDNIVRTNIIKSKNVTIATKPEALRKYLEKLMEKYPELTISAFIPLSGKYLNVDLKDKLIIVFNEDEYPGKVNPSTGKNETLGQPPYYMKDQTILDIDLTEMVNVEFPDNTFMSVRISNYDLDSTDVFTESRRPEKFSTKDPNPFSKDLPDTNDDYFTDDEEDFDEEI